MNILIIDDHALFREGLRMLLGGLSDELVFYEANGVGQLERAALDLAELILLDLGTSDSAGVESLRRVNSLNVSSTIVVVSGEDDPEVIRHCIDMGAAGYISKNSLPPDLIAALRLVLAGGIYLPPGCSSDRENTYGTKTDIVNALTTQQCRALLLTARGKSNNIIAHEMNIVESAVQLHLSTAYRVLGVSNRTEAVFLLSESGLTDADLSTSNNRVIDQISHDTVPTD